MVKYNIVLFLVLIISVIYNSEAQVFDITKYGAAPGGGDSSQAMISAWKEACAAPNGGTVLVPRGAFFMTGWRLEGPCKGPMTVNLQGTINAPIDSAQQPKEDGWLMFYKVDNFLLNGGGIIDGQGQQTWAKKEAKQIDFSQPYNLYLGFINNGMVTDITIQNSKMFQANVISCMNMTLEKVTINAPYESPNTDGIHIARSTDVKVLDCPIGTGDDCVSIGDGARQILVNGVRCGPGHGIAVGSLGKYENEDDVDGVLVKNCTLTNTENGLRIKTLEDSKSVSIANNIHFEDIIVTNVTYPINVDQEYCPSGGCSPQSKPSDVQLTNIQFKGITGTSSTKEVVKLLCSKSRPCKEVSIGNIDIKYSGPEKPEPLSRCVNVQPILTGTQNPPIIV